MTFAAKIFALLLAFATLIPPVSAQDTNVDEHATFLTDAPGLRVSIHPVVRPARAEVTRAASVIANPRFAPGRVSIIPQLRPDGLLRHASTPATIVQSNPVRRGNERRLCRSKNIWGQKLTSIPGAKPGCGIENPVRVTAISGVTLSQPSILHCDTAKALESWLDQGVKPAVGDYGGGVVGLRVVSHYSCRTRNSQPGAKISEHGKGRAIDIAGIILKNGQTLSVLRDWRKKATSKLMRVLHATACGPFRTVLGPNADKYHQDHFHFDTSVRGGKAYCR